MTDASPAAARVEMPQPQPHLHAHTQDVQRSPRKKTSARVLRDRDARDDQNYEHEDRDEDHDEYEYDDDARPRAVTRARQRLLGGGAPAPNTPRRRRAVRRATISSDDDDDDDGPETGGAQRRGMTVYMQTRAPELAPADVPRVLVGYVQFLFNLSVVLVLLYLGLALILTVQRDVEQRVSEYSLGVLAEIAACRQHWTINHCASPTHAAPILAGQCAEWAACMARDPSFVGRARVAAETLGEVVDSFVAPLSWKTLVFASCTVVLVNVLLSLYRAAPHHPHPNQQTTQSSPWWPPSPALLRAEHETRRRIA